MSQSQTYSIAFAPDTLGFLDDKVGAILDLIMNAAERTPGRG